MVIAAGILLTVLWGIVSLLTFGFPLKICMFLSKIFPVSFTDEIARMANGFYYDVPNRDMPAATFLVLYTIIFLIYGFVIWKLIKDRKRNLVPLIIVFSVLFRLIVLPSILIHENDIYRYIWDGKVANAGINPFKYAPAIAETDQEEHFSDEKKDDVIILQSLRTQNELFYKRIGYRKVPTIYPPVAQSLFSLSAGIGRDSLGVMTGIFCIFDILIIYCIYRLLLFCGSNVNNLVIYAWSPLVLKEFTNSSHLDPVPLFFLLAAILLLLYKKKISSMLCLAAGILAKLFPLVTVPFFMKRTKRTHTLFLGLIVAGAYIPFFFWGNTGIVGVFTGLQTYSAKWAVNGGLFESVFALLKLFVSARISYYSSKAVMALTYCICMIFLLNKPYTSDLDFLKRIFWSITWLFLLSPVGDPWYYCWVIPFLALFPFKSLIFLTWLLVFSYLDFSRDLGNISIGKLSLSITLLLQYVPFYIFFISEILRTKKKERCHVPAA